MPIHNFIRQQQVSSAGQVTLSGNLSTSYNHIKEGFCKVLPGNLITIVPETLEKINREIRISFYSGDKANLYFKEKNLHPKPIANDEIFWDTSNGGIAILGECGAETEIILEITVRQDKEFSYDIGNWQSVIIPPPPSWIIISEDQFSAIIDKSIITNPDPIFVSATVPNYELIHNWQYYEEIIVIGYLSDGSANGLIGSDYVYNGSVGNYPITNSDFIFSVEPLYQDYIEFKLQAEYQPTIILKILEFDSVINIFILGV